MESIVNQAASDRPVKAHPVNTVELTEEQFTSLRKLLLNGWSAEYCLRITPIIGADQDYLKSSLEWTFPQAYYSAYFAIRAIELLRNRFPINALGVLAAGRYHYEKGLYKDTQLSITFLDELYMLSRSSPAFTEIGRELDVLVTQEQQLLLTIINEAAQAHEAHLIRTIGITAFMEIVWSIPEYIRTAFLAERVGRIYMHIEHFSEA